MNTMVILRERERERVRFSVLLGKENEELGSYLNEGEDMDCC